MGKTKKVHTTGRFGARYGVKIKKRILKVELKQKKKHECPYCGKKTVKRIAAGLYECRHCNEKFTGGAYVPETMAGKTIKRMVAQKEFLPAMKELIELKEQKSMSESLEENDETEKEAKKKRWMKMYKCIKCGTTFQEFPKGLISCPSCAGKVIIKVRSNVTKTIKAV